MFFNSDIWGSNCIVKPHDDLAQYKTLFLAIWGESQIARKRMIFSIFSYDKDVDSFKDDKSPVEYFWFLPISL